jgi:hypothetical protein
MREKTVSKPLSQTERHEKARAVQIKYQFWFYTWYFTYLLVPYYYAIAKIFKISLHRIRLNRHDRYRCLF